MRKPIYSVLSSFFVMSLIVGCSGNSENTTPLNNSSVTGSNATPNACVVGDIVEPLRSEYAEGEVTTMCEKAIVKVQDRLQAIASIPGEQQTVGNTLMAFESAMSDFNDETIPLTFMGYVSTNEKVSAEGSECEQKIGQYNVDIYTRRDIYKILAVQKTSEPSQARLLMQTLQSFEQNGLKLEDSILSQVKELKSSLATKESQFSTNLNTDASSVAFTAQELTGATADFLGRLKKTEDGRYIVTTKNTDYSDLMQNVSVPETRRLMMLAYLNRGGEPNTKLLEEAIVLRGKIAANLGYKTWADYRTSMRMAKSGDNALEFLNNLKGKLADRNNQDMAQLLTFKKELDPTATKLDQWDITYLSYQLQKRDYSLDNEKIREYFPAKTVVAGIFEVYSKLLGVKYVEVTNAKTWAEGVKLYEIRDPSDCHLIAYFYTDLIPRAGKYGHAAAFPLITGRILGAGNYSVPIASMVANFNPPANGKPSLLTHDEVETFFHEFGHIMHQTLTTAPYGTMSGTAVAQDFVEAPSQMLENWVWNSKILNQISGHYLNESEKLPADLLEKMLAAKNFQQGAAYTKQLLYALFDMTLHTQSGAIDTVKTYDDLYRQIIGQEPLPGNRFAATFGHLMGGYDAGYYGYLWSEVYAQDMFSTFPADDLTNPVVGGRYRQIILGQGNMKDAIDLLREFLGREPNSDAFFKKLGL